MKPKKSLGQNFLTDNKLLSRIAEYGNISNSDTVLEIGPGTGNLTRKLINKNPAELIAIEKDNELSKLLYKRFDSKIKIFNKDILLTYKSFKFNKPIIVFGNLPYNISTKILVSFIKLENLNKTYKKFIFIFQKEVADRIIAQENTKNYGRLSILSSWKMHVEKVMDINPNYFFPKPKVWSSLLIFTPKFKFEKLFSFFGYFVWLKNENDFDFFTAMFGGGPAYFLYIMSCFNEISKKNKNCFSFR